MIFAGSAQLQLRIISYYGSIPHERHFSAEVTPRAVARSSNERPQSGCASADRRLVAFLGELLGGDGEVQVLTGLEVEGRDAEQMAAGIEQAAA